MFFKNINTGKLLILISLLLAMRDFFPKNYGILKQFQPSNVAIRKTWADALIEFEEAPQDDFVNAFIKALKEFITQKDVQLFRKGKELSLKLPLNFTNKEAFQDGINKTNKLLEENAIKEASTPAADILREAIMNDDPRGIEKAIKAGAIINFNFDDAHKSPLLHSLLSNSLRAAQALLNAGASVNIVYKNKKLIDYFINNKSIVLMLIQAGADCSNLIKGEPDLFNYVIKHRYSRDLAEELVEKGANLKPSADSHYSLFVPSSFLDLYDYKD